MAVHIETIEKGRDVYLDFLQNPKDFSFKMLNDTAKNYLMQSGAIQETPIQRLEYMNPKAIQLYLDHNIDIKKHPLKIGLCAQHCNG